MHNNLRYLEAGYVGHEEGEGISWKPHTFCIPEPKFDTIDDIISRFIYGDISEDTVVYMVREHNLINSDQTTVSAILAMSMVDVMNMLKEGIRFVLNLKQIPIQINDTTMMNGDVLFEKDYRQY